VPSMSLSAMLSQLPAPALLLCHLLNCCRLPTVLPHSFPSSRRAIERGQWVLLDSANLCNPTVLDRLNPLLEPHGAPPATCTHSPPPQPLHLAACCQGAWTLQYDLLGPGMCAQ
jgi:hypothetical protein